MGDAHVSLGLGAAADELRLSQHLHHRLILLPEPGLGHLAAAHELAPVLGGPEAPGLHCLRQRGVAPLVRELDAGPLLGGQRHALEEEPLDGSSGAGRAT